jgi:hypothetical protein
MAKIVSEGRTLYARNPKKAYAFEKVGEIAEWRLNYKSIWIDGKLYTLIQEDSP